VFKKKFVLFFVLKCSLVYLFVKWWPTMNVYFLLVVNDIQHTKVMDQHFNLLEISVTIVQSLVARWICRLSKTRIVFFCFFRRDNWGRKASHLVAIDALFFRQQSEQFYMKPINRELIKAYTGFANGLQPNGGCTFPVASGNWGCGAFNGDRQLKGLKKTIETSFWQQCFSFHSNYSINCCFGSRTAFSLRRIRRSKTSSIIDECLQSFNEQTNDCERFISMS